MTESHDREVIGGHLLVIGGAEDKYNERRILRKFLELAGGGADAQILIVPVASDFPEFAADVYTQAFRNLGVANPRVLRATSRQDIVQADVDKLLDGLTGVFIIGSLGTLFTIVYGMAV